MISLLEWFPFSLALYYLPFLLIFHQISHFTCSPRARGHLFKIIEQVCEWYLWKGHPQKSCKHGFSNVTGGGMLPGGQGY